MWTLLLLLAQGASTEMLVLVALLSFVSLATLTLLLILWVKTRHLLQFSAKIPGPKPVPIIGHIFEIGRKPEDLLERVFKLINQYPPVTRIWVGTLLGIAVTEPKHIEIVMSSSEHIKKAFLYKTLRPWLGTGLATSSGEKWRTHRKMLTPTFHFKILEQLTGVFNRNGDILIRRLSSHVDGPQFDITSYISMCSLDVICESAMGVNVKAQTDAGGNYLRSVSRMGYIAMTRFLNPWLLSDTVFALSALKSSHNECLNVLHGITNFVIRKGRQELMAQRAAQSTERSKEDESVLGSKRHMSFLEFLLQTSQNGHPLTDEEIREEVDTFMFEYQTEGNAIPPNV